MPKAIPGRSGARLPYCITFEDALYEEAPGDIIEERRAIFIASSTAEGLRPRSGAISAPGSGTRCGPTRPVKDFTREVAAGAPAPERRRALLGEGADIAPAALRRRIPEGRVQPVDPCLPPIDVRAVTRRCADRQTRSRTSFRLGDGPPTRRISPRRSSPVSFGAAASRRQNPRRRSNEAA